MNLHQIVDKVEFFDDPDYGERGCLTLEQEIQLVRELRRKTEALTRIAHRYPCETAQAMADEARRAL